MLGSREITTPGIVISRLSQGEGSARISLYTKEFGLIWAIARSAREERSKLRPHLQVGTYGTYTLVKGLHDWRITGAVKTQNSYFSLVSSELAQKSTNRVLGVVRQLMHGEEQDTILFDSLWEFLSGMDHLSDETIPIAERVVLLKILYQSGYISKTNLPEINASFKEADLSNFKKRKHVLAKAVNEGFVASGLMG